MAGEVLEPLKAMLQEKRPEPFDIYTTPMHGGV